ncbi:MAG: GNAT family N-acetyltransferase [Bacteroidota bacterium]
MLLDVGRRAFLGAFATQNSPENMKIYMDQAYTLESFQIELQHPDSFFFMLHGGEQAVGYLKLNIDTAQTDIFDPKALEIQRIYLLQEYLGNGWGKLMLDEAERRAFDLGKEYVWLGVWEHNQRAISFYEKHGYQRFSSHSFWLGKDLQTDLLMKKMLNRDDR